MEVMSITSAYSEDRLSPGSLAYSESMPGSILILWPTDPTIDTARQVAVARAAATEREPTNVLIAGGNEPASVADVRLDNASELRGLLSLAPSSSDEEILDAAFARWGQRFPEHLAGDFTWARWDPLTRELLLARDHMGIRPLVYARYQDGFAASTDIRSLRSLPGVDVRWDELYIAMSFTDIFLDRESTFHVGIKRLTPGSTARVQDAGRSVKVHVYWHLPTDDLRLSTEGEYVERFRELFLEAIRCRLPRDGCVATELSGGLDSTVVTAAIASMMSGRPLPAIAASFAEARYEGGRHDEGSHRTWARADPRIELLEIPASRMMTLRAVDQLMAVHGTPMAPVMDLVRLDLWNEAAGRGASTVFDGFDGDTAVNYGFERLMQLARGGHVITLGRETIAAYRKAGTRGLYETGLLLSNSTMHTLARHVRDPKPIRDSLASRDLLRRSGFLERCRAMPGARPGDVRVEHTLDLRSGTIALAIERLDVVATAAGVGIRHPFFDRRLVEYCVALPSDLLFRERMPRWIQRAALQGLGPASVLWRHDKGAMPARLADEALAALGATSGALPAELGDLVDLDRASEVLGRWRSERVSANILYPVFAYRRWLEHSATQAL